MKPSIRAVAVIFSASLILISFGANRAQVFAAGAVDAGTDGTDGASVMAVDANLGSADMNMMGPGLNLSGASQAEDFEALPQGMPSGIVAIPAETSVERAQVGQAAQSPVRQELTAVRAETDAPAAAAASPEQNSAQASGLSLIQTAAAGTQNRARAGRLAATLSKGLSLITRTLRGAPTASNGAADDIAAQEDAGRQMFDLAANTGVQIQAAAPDTAGSPRAGTGSTLAPATPQLKLDPLAADPRTFPAPFNNMELVAWAQRQTADRLGASKTSNYLLTPPAIGIETLAHADITPRRILDASWNVYAVNDELWLKVTSVALNAQPHWYDLGRRPIAFPRALAEAPRLVVFGAEPRVHQIAFPRAIVKTQKPLSPDSGQKGFATAGLTGVLASVAAFVGGSGLAARHMHVGMHIGVSDQTLQTVSAMDQIIHALRLFDALGGFIGLAAALYGALLLNAWLYPKFARMDTSGKHGRLIDWSLGLSGLVLGFVGGVAGYQFLCWLLIRLLS